MKAGVLMTLPKPAGEPGERDDGDGADDGAFDLAADAPLPEEASPFHPAIENRPLLYVQILDDRMSPRAGLAFEVHGTEFAAPRRGVTDENGELLIDDCGAGVYEITADDKRFCAHTLSQLDLDQDGAAYRVVL